MPEEKKIQYSIGVDIGGTKMSAVLFDLVKKEVAADYKLATPKNSLEKFLVMLQALIDPLLERAKKGKGQVTKIGIGVPGIISAPTNKNEQGEVLHCNNCPYGLITTRTAFCAPNSLWARLKIPRARSASRLAPALAARLALIATFSKGCMDRPASRGQW